MVSSYLSRDKEYKKSGDDHPTSTAANLCDYADVLKIFFSFEN
jgi:hypothetical protein